MSDVAGYWKRKLADKPSADAWESAYQRAAVRAGLVSRPIVPRFTVRGGGNPWDNIVWDDPGPDIDADAELVMGSAAWREKMMAGSDSAWFARLTWDGRPMTSADLGLEDCANPPPPFFWLGRDAE